MVAHPRGNRVRHAPSEAGWGVGVLAGLGAGCIFREGAWCCWPCSGRWVLVECYEEKSTSDRSERKAREARDCRASGQVAALHVDGLDATEA